MTAVPTAQYQQHTLRGAYAYLSDKGSSFQVYADNVKPQPSIYGPRIER